MVVPHQPGHTVGDCGRKAAGKHHFPGRRRAELLLIPPVRAVILRFGGPDPDIMDQRGGFQRLLGLRVQPLLPANERRKAVDLDKMLDAGRVIRVIVHHF